MLNVVLGPFSLQWAEGFGHKSKGGATGIGTVPDPEPSIAQHSSPLSSGPYVGGDPALSYYSQHISDSYGQWKRREKGDANESLEVWLNAPLPSRLNALWRSRPPKNHSCVPDGQCYSGVCLLSYGFSAVQCIQVEGHPARLGRDGCLAKACEPNKEQLRVHPESRSILTFTVQMASSTNADKSKQPKLDVDKYLSTAISATPADLHPYFESFQNLHSKRYAMIYSHFRYPYVC